MSEIRNTIYYDPYYRVQKIRPLVDNIVDNNNARKKVYFMTHRNIFQILNIQVKEQIKDQINEDLDLV